MLYRGTGKGLRGKDWFSGRTGGIPFLVHRGVPYPGYFDSSGRTTVNLEGIWQILFDGQDRFSLPDLPRDGWRNTTVPSVYNATGSAHRDYVGKVWYRRTFQYRDFGEHCAVSGVLPVLEFQGLLLRGAVWMNGVSLGSWEGGYTTQVFPLPPGTLGISNELVVLTDNRLTPDSLPPKTMKDHNPGWHRYGGIYRGVSLCFLPAHNIVKTEITNGSKNYYDIRVLTWNRVSEKESILELELFDGDGTKCHTGFLEPVGTPKKPPGEMFDGYLHSWTGKISRSAVAAWSCSRPVTYQYSLTLTDGNGARLDTVRGTTGFRTFTVDASGFLVNGKRVFLRGISKHEDHPDSGPVQTTELIRQDLDLIQELGANYIRLAHYPHDVRELAAARDRGFLVSGELPLYQAGIGFAAWFMEKRPIHELPLSLFGLRQISRPQLLENARLQLMQMIERDRNNPALVFWCVGNECYTLGRRSGRVFKALADCAHFFDSSRPVTNAELTYRKPLLDRLKRGWTGMDFYCLNSYFGWYYGSVDELPAFLEKHRARWGKKPLVLSEFGADAAPGRSDSDGPWSAERVHARRTYSEEYQAALLRHYVRTARESEWVAGVSPWVFSDFYNTWFPGNPVPNYNLKGIVSARRVPKKGYAELQRLYREGMEEKG